MGLNGNFHLGRRSIAYQFQVFRLFNFLIDIIKCNRNSHGYYNFYALFSEINLLQSDTVPLMKRSFMQQGVEKHDANDFQVGLSLLKLCVLICDVIYIVPTLTFLIFISKYIYCNFIVY